MDEPDHPGRKRRRWWWGLVGVVALVLVAVIGTAVWWATDTPDPEPAALAALESDDQVTVTKADGYTFDPGNADVGFILYPGGRIDPASCAAPARQIAEAGHLVVVPQLTLSLAVLDANAADDVIAAHPEIETWVVGGHSLGGAMAARYARDHPESVAGLTLWAAYPEDGTDLSAMDLATASIFGTEDGLTSEADIDDSRRRLPADTEFVPIVGGNHAQFCDYGPQAGDNPATISVAEQQAQAVAATLRVLEAVAE